MRIGRQMHIVCFSGFWDGQEVLCQQTCRVWRKHAINLRVFGLHFSIIPESLIGVLPLSPDLCAGLLGSIARSWIFCRDLLVFALGAIWKGRVFLLSLCLFR